MEKFSLFFFNLISFGFQLAAILEGCTHATVKYGDGPACVAGIYGFDYDNRPWPLWLLLMDIFFFPALCCTVFGLGISLINCFCPRGDGRLWNYSYGLRTTHGILAMLAVSCMYAGSIDMPDVYFGLTFYLTLASMVASFCSGLSDYQVKRINNLKEPNGVELSLRVTR